MYHFWSSSYGIICSFFTLFLRLIRQRYTQFHAYFKYHMQFFFLPQIPLENILHLLHLNDATYLDILPIFAETNNQISSNKTWNERVKTEPKWRVMYGFEHSALLGLSPEFDKIHLVPFKIPLLPNFDWTHLEINHGWKFFTFDLQ